MPDAAPRPAQVTIAASLVMAGSVFLVLAAFDQIAGLRSMETREAVEEFVSNGFGKTLGLDVQGALSLMRVLTMVSAGCATAAVILGYQVLRRSRSARLVLSLLAVPILVAGFGFNEGVYFAPVIVSAIAMMWVQPARDWIDGKTPKPAPSRPEPAQRAAPPPPVMTPPPPTDAPTASGSGAREVSGFGDRLGLLASLPPPRTAPIGAEPTVRRRPPALVWACVLAWAGSGLMFVAMLVTVVATVASPDRIIDELYRQNPSLESELGSGELRDTILLAGALIIIWSLTAIVLAAFAWAGRDWAWTGLVVSSVCSAGLCLLGVFGNPALVVGLGVCAAAAILLLRPEVRAYFR